MTDKPLLYTSPGSHHSRRVALLIHEAGMDVAERIVDVRPPGMGGENESEAFRQLNPMSKVPVLTHGDFVLRESNAIMVYLCETYSTVSFWPEAAESRAAILSWQFWQAAHLSSVADELMSENMGKPMMGLQPDKARLEDLESGFHRVAGVLDQHLSGRDYLVEETLTCADLSVVSAFMYAHAARLPLERYANIRRWRDSLHARPSWQATEPPPMPDPTA